MDMENLFYPHFSSLGFEGCLPTLHDDENFGRIEIIVHTLKKNCKRCINASPR